MLSELTFAINFNGSSYPNIEITGSPIRQIYKSYHHFRKFSPLQWRQQWLSPVLLRIVDFDLFRMSGILPTFCYRVYDATNTWIWTSRWQISFTFNISIGVTTSLLGKLIANKFLQNWWDSLTIHLFSASRTVSWSVRGGRVWFSWIHHLVTERKFHCFTTRVYSASMI